MKARCLQPRHRDFPRYGGRGITVDLRWIGNGGFVHFLADMGERPAGLTLDRIDNDGTYEPSNCRWSTPDEQRHNRPQTRGWKQRYTPPKNFGWKEITCLDCQTTGNVRSTVWRWRCPVHKQIAQRQATARYKAKARSSSNS